MFFGCRTGERRVSLQCLNCARRRSQLDLGFDRVPIGGIVLSPPPQARRWSGMRMPSRRGTCQNSRTWRTVRNPARR